MAINKKLIHFKKYSDFVGNSGINGVTSPINGYYHNIHESSIVFIQDTKQIWTHGLLYDGSTFDPTDIEASIQDIKDNYVPAEAFSSTINGIANNLNTNIQGVSNMASENKNRIDNNDSRITTLENKASAHEYVIANKADKTELPTKVSLLDNDACYVLDIVIDNGIYAIESGGNLIPASEATPSCIGVAVVLGEHRFMIGKYTQKLSEKPIWGNSSYLSITNYETVDGTNSIGYLIEEDADGDVILDSNYHNWTEGALSDFWGNRNTNVMREKGLDGIVPLVDSFNNGNIGDNQGKTDWYVPSCGQLALIVLNMAAISSVLLAIGGDDYETLYNYWCSTESTIDTAWRIDMSTSKVHTANKSLAYRVCLIRSLDNLKSITERVSDLESNINNKADKTDVEVDVEVEVEIEAPNGVYAITVDDRLIDYNLADSTAIGVVLIDGEHKFVIAKNNARYSMFPDLYWGKNLEGIDIAGITNTSDPVVDFNGKENTAAIIAAYTEHGVSMDMRDMCSVLNTFNASDTYNDWYIPACGQLALMYPNITEIDAALAKIGGTALATLYHYWSSSEIDSNYAWSTDFNSGPIPAYDKGYSQKVRFVRDLPTTTTTTVITTITIKKPLKEKVSEIESQIGDINTVLESIING